MVNQTFQDLFNAKPKDETFNNKDFFKYYRMKFGQTPGLYIREFSNIVSDFFEEIGNELFKPNYRIRLPFGIGDVYLQKHKCKTIINKDGKTQLYYPIDWYETNKLWQEDEEARKNKTIIRHTNDHTGGFVYRIRFKRGNKKDKGNTLMQFIPARSLKYRFADYLKENDGFLNCDIREFLYVKKEKDK